MGPFVATASYGHYLAITAAPVVTDGLPFTGLGLLALVVWVYLCLYCVQLVHLGGLLPRRWKTLGQLGAFVAGPAVICAIVLYRRMSEGHAAQEGLLDALREALGPALRRITGHRHHAGAAGLQLMDSAGRTLDQIYGHGQYQAGKRDRRILNLTEQIIADALDRRASDILIDPADASSYEIRYRIDGVLRTVKTLPAETCKAVINSIKAVSNMDIAERRRPQDGAFTTKKGQTSASFRVASAGVVNGEKLAIRVLSQRAGTYRLDDLGLTSKQLNHIRQMIARPSGMLLMCGPTGSGKTTTLYALLNEMDRFTRNVITVEDPIEAVLPNTSQIEVNPKADITFAKALRSILRQDPDVICVGEIRDEETAEIALRASQTGHLVVATMHCDSNAAAIVRLLDLGISPLLVSSGLSMLLSQRLLRCLCEECKQPAELSQRQVQELVRHGIDPRAVYQAVGCRRCDGTGYYGRTAIGDLLAVDDRLKDGIAHNTTSLVEELRHQGNQKGRSNLHKQAIRKLAQRITTLEEIKRVLG